MTTTCTCPVRDWYHNDASWIEYAPDCPIHAEDYVPGLHPTEPPKEEVNHAITN